MRQFLGGDDLWIEPWRAKAAFPVISDLVNRGAL